MYQDHYEEPQRPIQIPFLAETPIATFALIGINIVVWMAATAGGGTENSDVLIDFGAMFGPLIANGEYWRLFTAMFLHSGIAHLGMNSFALLIFGPMVERSYGHGHFVLIYVLVGLSGSVASYLFNSIAVGAGASGAIFGIAGAFAAFFVVQREALGRQSQQNLIGISVLIGINLFIGFQSPGIDNWAHLGGLAGGFGLGLAFAPRYRRLTDLFGGTRLVGTTASLLIRWWVVPVTLVVLALSTWLATATLPKNAFTHLYLAERYYDQGSYHAAFEEIDKAVSFNLPVAEAHLLRGRIYAEIGNVAAARSELGLATRLGNRGIRSEAVSLLADLRQ